MKKYLFSALLTLTLCLSACSENELPVDVTDAEQQGRADAKALCQAQYTADRDLHSALLAVKSREFEMRLSGDTLSASAYIEAFKQQLRETNQQLAAKVL